MRQYGRFPVKSDATLQIVSAGMRVYVFRAEEGCPVWCRANLKCLEIR